MKTPGRDCVMALCACLADDMCREVSGLKGGLKGQKMEHLHCRQRKRPLHVPEPHLPRVMMLHVPSSQEHQRHLYAELAQQVPFRKCLPELHAYA